MILHLLVAVGVLELLTIVPGPDMAVVTRRALVGGRPDALRTVVGVVCGLLVWGGLTALGLSVLLTASPRVYLVVKLAGAAYLVFLGFQSLRGRNHRAPAPDTSAARGHPFVTGLAANLLNPKIAVFYTALLPTLAPRSWGVWGLGALAVTHAGLTLGWLSGYAYALTRARAFFERPGVRRTLDRITGVVLVGFAVRLATERPL